MQIFTIMKKAILLCILACSISSYAFQTILTTSIYTSEGENTNIQHSITEIPTSIKRVRFINRITTCPEIETALTAAEYIFSNAMESEYIDLVPIEAEVMFGEDTDFEHDEISKVLVYYTDEISYNAHYADMGQYQYNDIPTLIPMSMYNQCAGESNGPCMQIKLNPNLSYHYGTESVPSEKYDAITILLRSLAIGCGIQSTLEPNSLQLGLVKDGVVYINAFDTHIYNDSNVTYSDVVLGNISIEEFLGARRIYAKGYTNSIDTLSVELFNDWEVDALSMNLTNRTFNTISPWNYTEEESENGFYDLLDVDLFYGIEQRTVSRYTMALLRGLGWKETIPVGFEDDDIINTSTLHCNATTLLPNQTYSVWLSNNIPVKNLVCILDATDSLYTIGTSDEGTFSYQSIPSNVQWKRNPITKNIIGKLQCKVTALINDKHIEQIKVCDIEIPYKPNNPLVQKTETTTDGALELHLKAFANGSNSYTIQYEGVTYGDSYSFTCSADALDTIINNIPATQLYNLSLFGTNSEGNSNSYNFTFGSTARPALNMTVSVKGTILTYDLSSNGTIDISNVKITSVKIHDAQGVLQMTSNAWSGDPIDISSLARGKYILSVVADDITHSRLFIRR